MTIHGHSAANGRRRRPTTGQEHGAVKRHAKRNVARCPRNTSAGKPPSESEGGSQLDKIDSGLPVAAHYLTAGRRKGRVPGSLGNSRAVTSLTLPSAMEANTPPASPAFAVVGSQVPAAPRLGFT